MSIHVHDIEKRFGTFVALDRVSLDFPNGELVALLGPSGCGKTTLLRIIAGLETADSGRIVLDGEDASHKHVRERQVGFVFQHYALFRHMSVFENVAFGLRVKPRRQRLPEAVIRKKVMDLLELVQLGWLADRNPAQLSGGQRQRIALARALAVEPQVLLLDEPFGALDAKVRKELRRWLRQLHDELHVTSIFVTHDQEEALEVADRVVLMNHGRIEQIGTPREVYQQPASSFVYGFLGSSNVFHGTVENGLLTTREGQFACEDCRNFENVEVTAYVRPHEMHIQRQADRPAIQATVRRVLEIGALARVELSSAIDARHFEVEMPQRDITALSLNTGDQVQLVPGTLHIFPTGNGVGSR